MSPGAPVIHDRLASFAHEASWAILAVCSCGWSELVTRPDREEARRAADRAFARHHRETQ